MATKEPSVFSRFFRSRRGGAKGFFLLILAAALGMGVYYFIKAGNVEFQRARVNQVVEMIPPKVFLQSESAIQTYIYRNIQADAPDAAIEKGDIKVFKVGNNKLKVKLSYTVHIDAGPFSKDKLVEDVVEKEYSGYAMTPIMKAHEAAGQIDDYHKRQSNSASGNSGGGSPKDKARGLQEMINRGR